MAETKIYDTVPTDSKPLPEMRFERQLLDLDKNPPSLTEGGEKITKITKASDVTIPNTSENNSGDNEKDNKQHQKTLAKQPEGQEDEKKDKRTGLLDSLGDFGKFISIILSALGLNKEEEANAKKDLTEKSTVAGGKAPTSNDVANTTRNVTGLDPSILLEVRKIGQEAHNGGINFQADTNARNPLVTAKQQEASAGHGV